MNRADAVLQGLNDEQRTAAQCQRGPVLIVAGPGTGKTRTVTRRIAYGAHTGSLDPARAMALTFTSRAAGELHRRLAALGAGDVAARTFHSAALRQLRHFWPEAVGGEPPTLVSDRTPLLAEAVRRAAPAGGPPVSVLRTELDWMTARGIDPADYVAAADRRDIGDHDPAEISAVLAGYGRMKAERGVIDFDDVLLLMIALLDRHGDIRDEVRRRYRWYTVDEYQDVSPLQQRLLDLWLGDRGEICAVGDPAQAIFAFAGADPGLISSFPRRHPGATTVRLTVTYRCAPRIVVAANGLGRRIPGATGLRPADTAQPGSVQTLQYPSDAGEADGVAREIAGLIRGGLPPAEIAVLYRVNHQAARFTEALRQRGVPWALRGSQRYFERPEVREALVRLRGQVREQPGRTARQAWDDVAAAMAYDPRPPVSDSARERWESLAALAGLAEVDLPADKWLADLDRRAADGDAPRPPAVSLLTLHSAKGLEWDTVFIVGAWDGMLPLAASDPDQQEEELRLAYVGVSRARRRVVVSFGAVGGDSARRRPSPYLAGMAETGSEPMIAADPSPSSDAVTPAVPPMQQPSAGVLPPARCRECDRALVSGSERVLGRCRTCPAPQRPDLLGRLQDWRARVAAATGVPGYAVMTAATMQAIAETVPGTEAQLAEIPGMTARRVEEHGPELLAIVAARDADQAGSSTLSPLS